MDAGFIYHSLEALFFSIIIYFCYIPIVLHDIHVGVSTEGITDSRK